ncbi:MULTISPECIES: hypothetical protein [unclassified Pseudomonas]|uniref:hypothetical protein n=1 Tax=unclassified Pseudomonas TaxID=196821 RepID=UPI001F599B2C|nr:MULTISPECIES: hypothetical protein [unclassified Pseudomonas]
MFSAALILGGLIMAGCAFICIALDSIRDEMERANDLKEAEIRSKNFAATEPGSTSN